MSKEESVYRQPVMNEMWRLASLIDRNPYSRTKGSFSRTHWAWKFEDFPFPRMQEGVYALCRLHGMKGSDNPFFNSPAVEKWIAWGFEYWAGHQHRNGSFDEAYPNEQCLAATAFTTFYLGSAYLLWKEKLDEQLQLKLEAVFERAGTWLLNNDETHGILFNHLATAVAALEIMARICGRADFSARARFFLQRIFDNQSQEGWIREYDGADIGYGTHGLFYLAAYWKLTSCKKTLESMRGLAGFFRYFIHPDGTLGGEYASRNTEFYYPAGFEMMAGNIPDCAAIAGYMRESVRERRVCGVWSMDAFNFMPMLNNLLFAMEAEKPLHNVATLPWQEMPFEKYFPHAGLWVVNRQRYYAIIGLSKGGTVSVFDKEKRLLAARHAGLICCWNGKVYTSQDCIMFPPVVWSEDKQSLEIEVFWKSLANRVFNPSLFIAFRLFTLTLGRYPVVSRWVKDLLVQVLIRRKKRLPIRHQRNIHLKENGVVIKDDIALPSGAKDLCAAEQFTAIHMGSSMYCDIRSVKSSAGVVNFPVGERGTVSIELLISDN